MRNIRDHVSGDLFERWDHLGRKRLKRLQNSWAEIFRSHVIHKLPVGKLAAEFEPRMGRPTVDVSVVMGALILQQIFNLTDEETVEALAFNIAWQYALDVRADSDLEMTDRTLRNYRKLVIDIGLDEIIFQDVTDELIRAFGVDTSKQRLDSTAFKSAMRGLTRLGTFVETISKFIRELRRTYPKEYKRIDQEIVRKYVDREGEGSFGLRPIETRRRLPEAAQTLYELVTMFRGTEASRLESFKFLERVFIEQCAIEDDDKGGGKRLRVKEPGEIGFANLNNPSDPDSSYNAHKGRGYMAQVMETYIERGHGEKTAPDIITHVAVGRMTEDDSWAVMPALDDVETRGIKPESVVADTPYGTRANRADASTRGVKIVSPVRSPMGYRKGRLSLEHFELDENDFVVKCPAGKKPASTNAMKNHMDARFDPETCAECELGDICPCGIQVRIGKKPRLWYRYERIERREKLFAQRTVEFKDEYRWRAGIEATFSRLKHWLGLADLRIRCRPAVTYALRFKALGLNILRCTAFATA